MPLLLLSLLLGAQLTMMPSLGSIGASGRQEMAALLDAAAVANVQTEKTSEPTGADESAFKQQLHQIDLKRWGIYNDGTHAVETTEGLNKALAWAHEEGIHAATLQPGTYLIDKNSRIDMVGDMRFELTPDVILQKETNGMEHYELLAVDYGANNVILRGGTYLGDKDTHNYEGKDNPHTWGTHESGFGIALYGVDSVTIDGVKASQFTGDGLIIGGHGTMAKDIYENNFESGSLDESGKELAAKGYIRTIEGFDLTLPIFQERKEFELANPISLPNLFDMYFYDSQNKFISKLTGKKARDIISIPEGAARLQLVFKQEGWSKAYIELWNRTVSTNVVVKNSEFSYNRRQGITVGGADGALIENNELHHIKGTAPQSGIDVEGGFGDNGNRNSDIIIRGNAFHDNAAYDVILYDGKDALVENNHMASKGLIGLAVSEPFTGAVVRGNHFDGTRIVAYHDVTLLDNKLNDSYTTLIGPRIKVNGLAVTDGIFSISASQPFGVSASNVTIDSRNKDVESGMTLSGKKVILNHITINGESKLRSFSGNSEAGSIINHLKIIGYNSKYGLSLPPAYYNYCEFEGAAGDSTGAVGISSAGLYSFNHCRFSTSSTAAASIIADHPDLQLTIMNSSFELGGDSSAISIQSAKKARIENNDIKANALAFEKTEIIRINDYWKREEAADVLNAVIRGNRISTNIAAIGISTLYAGAGAPAYDVSLNQLTKARYALKDNDTDEGNARTP
ncbi:right-handed parallel beta-helix repeat-containing protein [Paenibacillus sp. HB172176]|uniref:right-handed parallel beta-helix repeat-containing protein n=1 Tax=Paenibacillus sp. HB172176 TaxID=2493690 RepID=UPI00143B3F0B|nr:right-handed parallel beta-helix repeat-containing protein [Paenibacillus sp. HB172176]